MSKLFTKSMTRGQLSQRKDELEKELYEGVQSRVNYLQIGSPMAEVPTFPEINQIDNIPELIEYRTERQNEISLAYLDLYKHTTGISKISKVKVYKISELANTYPRDKRVLIQANPIKGNFTVTLDGIYL